MLCEEICMVRIIPGALLLLVVTGCLVGCAVHPVTLDKQLMIVSEEKEIAIGNLNLIKNMRTKGSRRLLSCSVNSKIHTSN